MNSLPGTVHTVFCFEATPAQAQALMPPERSRVQSCRYLRQLLGGPIRVEPYPIAFASLCTNRTQVAPIKNAAVRFKLHANRQGGRAPTSSG